MFPKFLKFFLKPFVRLIVQRSLVGRVRSVQQAEKGRFTRTEISNILRQAWYNYGKLADQSLLKQNLSFGNKIVVLLACLTLSLLQSLLTVGIDREYAIELTADVTWKVMALSVKLPNFFIRVVIRDPVKRIHIPYSMLMRALFNTPGFQYQIQLADDGITMDILRCPVAAYFQAHQAQDVCIATWCNLDFGLTEAWGGQLERSGTIAMGCERCDFKVKVQ